MADKVLEVFDQFLSQTEAAELHRRFHLSLWSRLLETFAAERAKGGDLSEIYHRTFEQVSEKSFGKDESGPTLRGDYRADPTPPQQLRFESFYIGLLFAAWMARYREHGFTHPNFKTDA